MLLAEWQVGEVFWAMFWFTLFFLWIWLLIAVFADIFRSHDLSGWAKALWCFFVIITPFLGVFVYLIARGGKMHERVAADARAEDATRRAYIQDVAGTSPSPAAEVEKLAKLHDQGAINDAEYERLKAKALAS
jgi:Short C-terminal domain/Phospholipase_D-nuclease N-terminal